ncbi:rhomboid family intramembrane serine protease [Flavobacterium sp.]|uniref:rhomboid family intramembrane serine protease n=1 Tax=Flavobacterium sp. TaxID=239 RepID=UPI00286A23D7|nr:rhomboid family intramembrane serine protease [Flavobacterium sp.]
MREITPVVKQLLIINILFFVGTQILQDKAYMYFALFPFNNPNFQIWQLLTHMFMHGGIMHIAFNMFALYSFGSMLESIWGNKKFLFFYISCGLGAGIMQNLINLYTGDIMTSAVGASGAIYGLLVAFAFMFPDAQLAMMFIPVPIKAKYFVPGILAIDLFLGIKGNSIFGGSGTGIAHFAHIGGALIGFIMMWYWKKNSFNNRRWN